ncbi:MAG: hypothetical protein P4L57_13680 [Rhizomicrobium sp.]|nr:hypothetical protein [Rhizomicrobium sp.]
MEAVTFRVFRDELGHWCARRSDGLVFGVFREKAAAVSFARREGRRDGVVLVP